MASSFTQTKAANATKNPNTQNSAIVHSCLVFVAVAHPVKLFNWGERSLTPGFRSRRMIHFDPNEHDCNPGLSPHLAIVRNCRGLIYGQLFHNRIWEKLSTIHQGNDQSNLS